LAEQALIQLALSWLAAEQFGDQLTERNLQKARDDYLETLANLDRKDLHTKDDALDVFVKAN